ncbi:unnamed protein product [Onchocerca flexuosa]|uniref:Uncharacterized protein n=1 Tax=Onchocerca flexuosa TaxID=387005 RepID=A0A183I3C0_9BILA|nr:unnamed protein product [Onchocerca flexuosa]
MEEKMGWKGGMDGWMDGGGEVLILGTADGKSSSGRQQQTATAAAGVAHTAHSNAFCMLCVWLP